jgi:CRP/FNR family cyclic AMP-dependent transcriptional regulator
MATASFFEYPTGARAGADDFTFLPGASDEDWAKLLAHTETLRFPAGAAIVRAGELDRALYFLVEGTVAVGDSAISAPSVLGEVAFLDGKPRSLTVRARTDCEALRLSADAFEVLAAREPLLGRAILFDLGRILAARLRRATEAAGWTE